MPDDYDFIVGTFNTPQLYTLTFTPPSTLTITKKHSAIGSHSWLHLTPPFDTSNPTPAQPRGHSSSIQRRNLYATAWTEPPSVVAYAVESPTSIKMLGQARTKTRSGYVTASDKACYSAGGASGEVFALDTKTGCFISPPNSSSTTGSSTSDIVEPLQPLSFVDDSTQKDDGSVMDFGGLRHGAHSADLSPDGKAMYIADIGRNCIWTYSIDGKDGTLKLCEKHVSPRSSDGPRHVWPHPKGKVVYCLQEHTSMVDVFETDEAGVKLKHKQGVRIIPEGLEVGKYWADEVRTSLSDGGSPKWMYASTRGLEKGTKGYVAVYAINGDGFVDEGMGNSGLCAMWETPTSGGWANAVQPGPTVDGVEYVAMTDTEGLVFVISWDGKEVKEVARVKLDEGAGAATAVWF